MGNAKKEPKDRAKTSKTVRLDDKNGFSTKFNKTKFQCETRKELFYFFVKCYEQELRRQHVRVVSPVRVVTMKKKFVKFGRFSENLRPIPEEFQSFTDEKKRAALQKLVDEHEDEAALILGLDQDVHMQVNNPDSFQVDEGRAADINPGIVKTLSHDASLQNVAWNQLDNPQGRPPPSPYVHSYEHDLPMSKVKHRAPRVPGISPEFERLEFDKLEELELSEALKDDSNTLLRIRLEEIYAKFEEDLTSKDPQNQLSMPLMEDIGPGASYSQARDSVRETNEALRLDARSSLSRYRKEIPSKPPEVVLVEDPQNQLGKASMEYGVKNIASTMPGGEQDGFLRNRSISEALEVVSRSTGRLKANIGDIRPQVHVDNMDEDLVYGSKAIMEGVNPQAKHLEVNDFCGGGENWMTTLNYGGNDTLQSVTGDWIASDEPSDVEKWAEGLLDYYAMATLESSPSISVPSSPVWYVSIDTLPA